MVTELEEKLEKLKQQYIFYNAETHSFTQKYGLDFQRDMSGDNHYRHLTGKIVASLRDGI